MEVTGFPLFSSSARLRDMVATIEPIPCQGIKKIRNHLYLKVLIGNTVVSQDNYV